MLSPLLLPLFLVPAWPSLEAPTEEISGPQIGPEIVSAFEAGDPWVNALILLEAPGLVEGPRLSRPEELARRAGQIDELQERFLASLPAGSLELVYRYDYAPAFCAWIDARAFDVLRDSDLVAGVGADVAGRSAALLSTSVDYVGAPAVHSAGTTGAGCTIAVLDSGIDTNHADLSDDIAAGAWTFLQQSSGVSGPGAEDDTGHGTHVSGVITSSGSVSSVGVAPDAEILPVKVLNSSGTGFVGDWSAGVDYVISVKDDYADLCAINMSLETFDTYGGCPCNGSSIPAQIMHIELQTAKDCGITSFAASGNDGECFRMSYPGCDSATIAVGASYEGNHSSASAFGCSNNPASGDKLACWSNQNPCIKLAAPGYRITSSWFSGGTSTRSGTSFATPHCTGGAALLRQADSSLTPDMIEGLLFGTGVPTTRDCGQTESRRVDLARAVQGTASASSTVRLGTPPNPDVLRTGATGGPILGTTWDPFIDHSSFVPNSVLDYLVIAFQDTNFSLPAGNGTLLVLPLGGQTTAIASVGTNFQVAVPNDFGLSGAFAFAQAAAFPSGPSSFVLTNALDLVVGYQ